MFLCTEIDQFLFIFIFFVYFVFQNGITDGYDLIDPETNRRQIKADAGFPADRKLGVTFIISDLTIKVQLIINFLKSNFKIMYFNNVFAQCVVVIIHIF